MPDLNCTEFESRLAEAVEDRLSPVELSAEPAGRELRRHAHACPECRRLWNDFALLDRVLPIWKAQVPPVDLADAVIARWRSETGHPASPAKSETLIKKSVGRQGLGILLAATTALACLAVLSPPPDIDDLPPTQPVSKVGTEPGPAERDQPGLLAQSGEADTFSEENEAERDWRGLARDAGSAYWALASDTADSFASVKVLVPKPKPDPAAAEPEPVEAKPASPWVEGIGAGLKPIGQDVGRAAGFLLDALPGESPTL